MKVKTADLIGAPLDWAVAKCEGEDYRPNSTSNGIGMEFEGHHFATDWSQAGPIIERERITLDYYNHICDGEDQVHARLCRARLKPGGQTCWYAPSRGPTVLIAAMRCYVASKLGEEVDVPDEFQNPRCDVVN